MSRGHRPLATLLLVLAGTGSVLAYHGEAGTAGLTVLGPVLVDGPGEVRAQPGSASFGPGSDVAFAVRGGVATVRIVEVRESQNPALVATGRHAESREREFAMPAPTIELGARGDAFQALVFTRGGLASVALDAPTGFRLERAEAGLIAPSTAARGVGLDPSAFALRDDAPAMLALAPRGTVDARGDFSLFVFDARLVVRSGSAFREERLGAWTERAAGGDVRVVRLAVIDFAAAALDARFTRGLDAFRASAVDITFDGTARLPTARGRAVVGDHAPVADGGPVSISGVLAASAWPTRGGDSVRFEARGDVTALAVGRESASFLRDARPAAAASLAVLALAALAWAWPSLKLCVIAPMYARFTGAGVMDHDARDRAFAFVRAHPGATVQAVAEGLAIAWSTAAYHLRVLEREGFLAGERRGRHRRFFAAGEPAAREALDVADHPTARRILRAVADSPGLAQKDLAAIAGITPSTAAWHLERLRAAGLLVAERDWRSRRYRVGPRFADVRGLVADCGGRPV